MEITLGRVCVRVAIDAPVDVVAIGVMERIHPQFAPLDIESRALGIDEPIAETELQFRGSDDVVVRPPLQPVIDTLLVDDQTTVLADRFDRVRGDPAVALGTLVRTRFRSDVFVEASFVDVSRCHRSHRVSGTRLVQRAPRPSGVEKNHSATARSSLEIEKS